MPSSPGFSPLTTKSLSVENYWPTGLPVARDTGMWAIGAMSSLHLSSNS